MAQGDGYGGTGAVKQIWFVKIGGHPNEGEETLDGQKRTSNVLLIVTGGGFVQLYTAIHLNEPAGSSAQLEAALAFFGPDEQPEFFAVDGSNFVSAEVAEDIQELELPAGSLRPHKGFACNQTGVNIQREEEGAAMNAKALLKDPDLPVGVVAYLRQADRTVGKRLWLPRFTPHLLLWQSMRRVVRQAYL